MEEHGRHKEHILSHKINTTGPISWTCYSNKHLQKFKAKPQHLNFQEELNLQHWEFWKHLFQLLHQISWVRWLRNISALKVTFSSPNWDKKRTSLVLHSQLQKVKLGCRTLINSYLQHHKHLTGCCAEHGATPSPATFQADKSEVERWHTLPRSCKRSRRVRNKAPSPGPQPHRSPGAPGSLAAQGRAAGRRLSLPQAQRDRLKVSGTAQSPSSHRCVHTLAYCSTERNRGLLYVSKSQPWVLPVLQTCCAEAPVTARPRDGIFTCALASSLTPTEGN